MKLKFLMLLPLIAVFSAANAAPVTDVQEFSNNTATEYFLDQDANKYSTPYYRWAADDWTWVHGGIAGTFTSAALNISAWDVDAPSENDTISLWDGAAWQLIGSLAGNNDAWAFTNFDLTSYLASSWFTTQVNSGLKVGINIDTGSVGWAVTLAKATLSLDGGSLDCVPQPGVPCTEAVPEPASIMLLASGLLGFGVARRKKNQA